AEMNGVLVDEADEIVLNKRAIAAISVNAKLRAQSRAWIRKTRRRRADEILLNQRASECIANLNTTLRAMNREATNCHVIRCDVQRCRQRARRADFNFRLVDA